MKIRDRLDQIKRDTLLRFKEDELDIDKTICTLDDIERRRMENNIAHFMRNQYQLQKN